MSPDRLSPGPGMERGHQSSPLMASQGWPASPGRYLQKEGSHFGKLKLQSEASLENSRQHGVVMEQTGSWCQPITSERCGLLGDVSQFSPL